MVTTICYFRSATKLVIFLIKPHFRPLKMDLNEDNENIDLHLLPTTALIVIIEQQHERMKDLNSNFFEIKTSNSKNLALAIHFQKVRL